MTVVDGDPGDATHGKNYKRSVPPNELSLIMAEGEFNAMAV